MTNFIELTAADGFTFPAYEARPIGASKGAIVVLQLYPASHGFNCDHRGAFDAPAATLVLQRTLAFFGQHLG